MDNFLEKNLKALKRTSPYLVKDVEMIEGNSKYEVFIDKDPLNINIIDKESNTPLYLSKPIDETIEKIGEFSEYSLYPYLYFFGIGNGVFFKLLCSNEALKRVVVIEPEVELLYIALHFVDLSKELEDQKIIILSSKDCNYSNINKLIGYKDAKIYSKLYNLFTTNGYYNRYTDEMVEINKIFIRAIEHNIVSIGNDATDSIMGLEHHIKNIPQLVKTPTVDELIGGIKNSNCAIIVSTGPSLHKQLPILKEIEKSVTIISIDASLPILEQWGIKPDVVVTLERIELTSEFYKKTSKEFQEGVVFAITSIVHKELRDSILSGTIQMSLRPFGYTRYFELTRWGYLGIGMSAANMAYEIVVHSRFQRVVLIGQDLAYGDDGKTHSKGYVLKEDEFKPSETNLYVERYGGGGEVRTNNIWKMFLNFFENDIANTPYNLDVINSTEGGARIQGAKEISFNEVASNLIDRDHKKSKIVLKPLDKSEQEAYLNHCKIKIKEMLEYGERVKKEVEECFLQSAKVTEKLEELNKEERLEEIDFEELNSCIEAIDKIKDYFLEEKFLWIFIDAVQSYIMHQELEIAKIQVNFCKDDIQKKAKQIEWIYAHKYWLFSLAGGMESVLCVVKRAASEWMEIPE